jgi:hypothetical protein
MIFVGAILTLRLRFVFYSLFTLYPDLKKTHD